MAETSSSLVPARWWQLRRSDSAVLRALGRSLTVQAAVVVLLLLCGAALFTPWLADAREPGLARRGERVEQFEARGIERVLQRQPGREQRSAAQQQQHDHGGLHRERATKGTQHGRVGTAQPLALLLVDMDNFKIINDRLGHGAGDAALIRLVGCARGTLRAIDCVARLGGDEFALLLPGTDLPAASAVASRLQSIVRHADGAPTLTLSIGVTLIGANEELATALGRADEALYAAKATGRDRVMARSQPVLALVRKQG